MIQFYAKERGAVCTADDEITTGSVGLPVCFHFSESWEGLAKTAVFRTGRGRTAELLLTGERCAVPAELLADPGDRLWIGVCGSDGAGVVIPTVFAEAGRIRRGAEPTGTEAAGFTAPLAEQLLAAASEAAAEARALREDAAAGAFSYVLTAADKTEIADAVLAALPVWQGGAY